MSTFAATISKVEKIWCHPDADRLVLAKVEGMSWQFCSQKGLLKEGDEVVYFPIDSLLPDDLAELLKVKPYLAGSNQDRIKTVKLRGQISQGLVISSGTIHKYLENKGVNWPPNDLTLALGIKKYDPPGVDLKGATLMPLPDGVSEYDIEGADNYPDIIENLMNRMVLVTEKMEGTNYSITIMPDDTVKICQRTGSIILNEGAVNLYWKVAEDQGYIEIAKRIQAHNFPGQQFTLRGEMIGPGIQKNIYGLEKKEVRWFDVLVDSIYLKVDTFLDIMSTYSLTSVPVLSKDKTLNEWLDGRTMQEASNGKSIVGTGKKREGIVVKTMTEDWNGTIGRLIIKQHSPEYLAKSNL